MLTIKWRHSCLNIEHKFPKVPKKHFSREEISKKANLNVPQEVKNKYIDILYKQQAAISMNKLDLGRAKNFTHKIHFVYSVQETV